MGYANYVNQPVALEKFLHKAKQKPPGHIFTLVLMWVSSWMTQWIEGWKILDIL
jgi:hypothetical protein